jgi:hypothetical protein
LLLHPKPPRLKRFRTEMMPKNHKKRPVRRRRLLLRFLKILAWIRRKRVEEFASSSTSAQRIVAEEAPGLEGGVELFDFLDS